MHHLFTRRETCEKKNHSLLFIPIKNNLKEEVELWTIFVCEFDTSSSSILIFLLQKHTKLDRFITKDFPQAVLLIRRIHPHKFISFPLDIGYIWLKVMLTWIVFNFYSPQRKRFWLSYICSVQPQMQRSNTTELNNNFLLTHIKIFLANWTLMLKRNVYVVQITYFSTKVYTNYTSITLIFSYLSSFEHLDTLSESGAVFKVAF